MRIIVWTSSYWNSPAEFDYRYDGIAPPWKNDPRTGAHTYAFNPAYKGRFGLKRWYQDVQTLFSPVHCFIACGTWSEPVYSRFGQLVTVVNAGVRPDRPQCGNWCYAMCAFTSAMAYALNRNDWDLLIHIPDDVLLGAVDWDGLLKEFLNRPEEVMGPYWYGLPCWFVAMKRAGAVRLLHRRLRPNLTEKPFPESAPFPEHEWPELFSGVWWNPWPEVKTIRRDWGHPGGPEINDEETMTWPFVRLPNPDYVERYECERTSLAKPVRQE